mmetsp:Transcript_117736/g.293580  ORF Transcript_117736/g.293580 Transcript_117736/m.293580 type:complete len:90 (+) Transcript_117736:1365-1634(+)
MTPLTKRGQFEERALAFQSQKAADLLVAFAQSGAASLPKHMLCAEPQQNLRFSSVRTSRVLVQSKQSELMDMRETACAALTLVHHRTSI